MLQLCEKPVFKPIALVRDIQENRTRAEVAFDKCAARMRCLVWWISAASRDTPPADCKRDD